ncbi:hypothetical protein HK102_004118, partial [Quaeritorhiza haematococci]
VCKRFAHYCRDDWLWRVLYEVRYGPPNAPLTDYREAYKTKACLKRPIESFFITWLSGYQSGIYWFLSDEPNSLSGRVAVLHQVCWLDVRGPIESVSRGAYIVKWRLKVGKAVKSYWRSNLGEVKLFAFAEGQDTEEEIFAGKFTNTASILKLGDLTHMPEQFQEVVNAQSLLHVRSRFALVQIRVMDRTDHWKSGLILDSVHLERISRNPDI